MALVSAYIPGTYSGTVNSGTPSISETGVISPSLSCGDVTNSMPVVGNSYAVDCDFITLVSTGTVFYMDTDTQQLTLAAPVSVSLTVSSNFTEEDIAMIYGVETGFICTAILLFGLIRQFKKISPLFF